jgi:hypothetical protein
MEANVELPSKLFKPTRVGLQRFGPANLERCVSQIEPSSTGLLPPEFQDWNRRLMQA